MPGIAPELRQAVENFSTRYCSLPDSLTGIRLSEDRWSLKEIIGHLIDSASNNHQRFVRLQLSQRLQFPEYQNERWLSVQRHKGLAWADLLTLWRSEATLSELTTAYLSHLQGHLEHFERRLFELREQGRK